MTMSMVASVRQRPTTSTELLGEGADIAKLGRPAHRHNRVVASWSGGIDSTAVIAHLAARGYQILAVTHAIYGGAMAARESVARTKLAPELDAIAKYNGGCIRFIREVDSSWIWGFTGDGVEIPHRNKHIIDRLCTVWAHEHGCKNIALGEYTGADSWLVSDHVAAGDADHRALASYLYTVYGIEWRLLSLQDFGESRYKSDRATLLASLLGAAAFDTTVCLVDSMQHCGQCYKCVERHAAFMLALGSDETIYTSDPAEHPDYTAYRRQMHGQQVMASHRNFPTAEAMPSAPEVTAHASN